MPTDRRSSAAEVSRRDILDAAEACFAERGFAAASMREIARRAKTSQALLHHHFGTKANLYDAVKQRFTDQFNVDRGTSAAAGGGGAPDPAFIVSTVRGYYQFLQEHPNLSRIGAWARLEGDEQAWGASDEIWARAREWVVGAKRAGLIRAEIDERLLLVVGGAMVQYWVEHRAFLCRALGLDPDEPGLDERYLAQALAVLLQGAGTKALDAVAAFPPPARRAKRKAS
ncbi:MAG TPA: helix-turn-helix domain-containing protein [Kofleriaceae bacterium]|nr:helix-turn-helix domain-containing protein [Kofleriaceae bacterium]